MRFSPVKSTVSLSISLAALLGISLPGQAWADEFTWKGVSNNWAFGKNWDGGKVPTSADTAVFAGGTKQWAGPASNEKIAIGAIIVRESQDSPAIIQPFKGAVSSLTLQGVQTSLKGKDENLLVANYSSQPLTITNRAKGLALNIDLAATGVVLAEGNVNIGSNIRGEGGIVKRGTGVLHLGDGNSDSTDSPEDDNGNTFLGDFVIEEGTVTSYRSSVEAERKLVASPFGLGTVYFKGGTIRSTSDNSRHYLNNFCLQGDITFGGVGKVNLSRKARGKTVLQGDTTITVDNRETHIGQDITGNYRLTKKGRGHLYLEGNVRIKELYVDEADVRIVGKLTCDTIVVGEKGSISGTGKIECPNIVNPGGDQDSEIVVRPPGKLPVNVYIKRPSTYQPGNPILLLMHGADRRGTAYRKTGGVIAEKLGMLLVCPEFDRTRFDVDAYQHAGIIKTTKENGQEKITAQPREEWTAQYLEPILDAVRRMEGKNLPYYLVGHSAGAQFVSRSAGFLPFKAERIVAVNPGSVLFPTRDQVYPYGFGGLPDEISNDDAIRRYLEAPLTFYCGTADVTTKSLPVDPPAMAQGQTRIERGRNIYAYAKKLAQERGWKFNWRLVEAEGVDHGSLGMWNNPNAKDAILGK